MSYYNGYKFFNDVFVSPTKSILKTIDKTKTQISNYMKEPYDNPSKNKSIKTQESDDDSCDEASLMPKSTRTLGHKSRHEVLSASTTASLASPKDIFESQKKSPKKLSDDEKSEIIKLHNRRIEVVQKEEGPILFVKGGYNQYVDVKSTKTTHFRKSVCQNKTKGGFTIIEEEDTYKLDNPFKTPFPELSKVLDDSTSKNQLNQKNEVEKFLSGELHIPQRKHRKSGSKKSIGGYDAHPLDTPSLRMSFTEAAASQNKSTFHKRISSMTPRVMNEGNSLMDPLLTPFTPRTTKAKGSVSLLRGDSFNQSTAFTDSFSLIKPETPINNHHVKKNSVIEFEEECIIYILIGNVNVK